MPAPPVNKLSEKETALAENKPALPALPPVKREPVIAERDDLVLLPVIEDELILSLPMYAYHAECDDNELVAKAEEMKPVPVETEAPNNPFSVLEQLKK